MRKIFYCLLISLTLTICLCGYSLARDCNEIIQRLSQELEIAERENNLVKIKRLKGDIEQKRRIIDSRSKLKLSLASQKKVYWVGESVIIQATWTNISNEEVKSYLLEFEMIINFDILNSQGEDLWLKQSYTRFGPDPEIILKPGQSTTIRQEVYPNWDRHTKFFKRRKFSPGKYKITVSGFVGPGNIRELENVISKRDCYAYPVNTVEIEVVGLLDRIKGIWKR